MKLQRIVVDHYRSIEHVEIDFPTGKPVVLFGPNNAGKSNILSAIDRLLGERYPTYIEMLDSDFYMRNKALHPTSTIMATFTSPYYYDRYRNAFRTIAVTYGYGGNPNEHLIHDGHGQRLYISSENRSACQAYLIDAERNIQSAFNYSSKYSLLSKFSHKIHQALSSEHKEQLSAAFNAIKTSFEETQEFSGFFTEFSEALKGAVKGFVHSLAVDSSAYDPNNYAKSLRIYAKEGDSVRGFEEFGTGEAVYDSFRNMAGISSAIVTNSALLEGLSDPANSYYSVNKLFDECVNYAQVNNLYTNGEMLMTLFDRGGHCYTNWSRNFQDYSYLRQESWVVEAENGKGHLVWNLFSPTFLIDKEEKYISVARAVYNGAIDDEALGVLIVSMPQSHLSQVLRGYCYGERDSVYVMGDGDTPILQYTPMDDTDQLECALPMMRERESGSFRVNTTDGMQLVSYYTLDAPWTLGEKALRIAHFTDFEVVVQRMAQFSRRMGLILAAVLLITLLIVGVIVRMLVKPIRQLAHVMGHYRLGDSLEGLDMTRQDEIGHLNRSFKRLTTNIQELFANLDKEYRIKERYRYESLRSQLNPHFLFNALNTIRYMSIMQHADTITKGIDALAAVLKYSIGHEEELSRLSEEIAHVRGYLEIQNMRFGQRIHLEEDFEPEVTDLYMLRFALQPIVENAVIHAFGENMRAGRECLIRLYGYAEDGILHLFVEDNGEGVSPQTLETLNSGQRRKDKMTGIGFSHVKELIEITFGKGYTLEITSHPGIGTVVHYVLPVITSMKEEDHEKSADRGR